MLHYVWAEIVYRLDVVEQQTVALSKFISCKYNLFYIRKSMK